jgi:hypothetical protein
MDDLEQPPPAATTSPRQRAATGHAIQVAAQEGGEAGPTWSSRDGSSDGTRPCSAASAHSDLRRSRASSAPKHASTRRAAAAAAALPTLRPDSAAGAAAAVSRRSASISASS